MKMDGRFLVSCTSARFLYKGRSSLSSGTTQHSLARSHHFVSHSERRRLRSLSFLQHFHTKIFNRLSSRIHKKPKMQAISKSFVFPIFFFFFVFGLQTTSGQTLSSAEIAAELKVEAVRVDQLSETVKAAWNKVGLLKK